MSVNNVAIAPAKGMIIEFFFLYVRKDQAINLLKTTDLTEKGMYYKIQKSTITYKKN